MTFDKEEAKKLAPLFVEDSWLGDQVKALRAMKENGRMNRFETQKESRTYRRWRDAQERRSPGYKGRVEKHKRKQQDALEEIIEKEVGKQKKLRREKLVARAQAFTPQEAAKVSSEVRSRMSNEFEFEEPPPPPTINRLPSRAEALGATVTEDLRSAGSAIKRGVLDPLGRSGGDFFRGATGVRAKEDAINPAVRSEVVQGVKEEVKRQIPIFGRAAIGAVRGSARLWLHNKLSKIFHGK